MSVDELITRAASGDTGANFQLREVVRPPQNATPEELSAARDALSRIFPDVVNGERPGPRDDFSRSIWDFTHGRDETPRVYFTDFTKRIRDAAQAPLPPEPAGATLPTPDELTRQIAESPEAAAPGEIDTGHGVSIIPPEDARYAGMGQPEPATGVEGSRQAAGTSNRLNAEVYGEGAVPSGAGVDTGKLLDNARADIASGAVDPYSVLSQTRQRGIANPEQYAALAVEHERLVNDAVAKQKIGAPDAPQAAQAAEDFANAIQPHKTAASDLFRLMQGDLNYDLSTPFGMDQYMKAELGRGAKSGAEAAKFNRMSQDIGKGETEVAQAVARSDVKVQRRYSKVADIPIEEAAARVREQLAPCVV